MAYHTFDGTALAGHDYVAAEGHVTFEPGETEKAVVVDVIGETLFEDNERFFLAAGIVHDTTGGGAGIVEEQPHG